MPNGTLQLGNMTATPNPMVTPAETATATSAGWKPANPVAAAAGTSSGSTSVPTTVPTVPTTAPENTYTGQDGGIYSSSQFDSSGRPLRVGTSSNPTPSDTGQATGMFQSEIDALNQVYAQQKAQAAVDAANLTGQTSLQLGRSGLAGSPFQTSEQSSVDTQNTANSTKIDNNYQSQLATIQTGINKAAQDIAAGRVTSAQSGVDATLAEIKARPAAIQAAVASSVTSALSSGLDPSTLSNADIADWVKKFTDQGMTVTNDDIINAIKTAQAAQTSATTKATSDKANVDKINQEIQAGTVDATKPISVGGYIYKPDGKGGWTNTGPARSTALPNATNVGNLQSQQAYATVAPQMTTKAQANGGYVTPDDYQTAKTAWINAGLPSSDFDADFASLVDPKTATTYDLDVNTKNATKTTTGGFQ